MKILALQGSPRREGNTQAVLEIVLQAAEHAGGQIKTVQLSELKNFSGCMECFACQKEPNEPSCALEDDFQPVLRAAWESDVVVWATPVFCWAPSWLAKMAMDRFFCMFKLQKDGSYESLLSGRRMATVISAGSEENDGADLVKETCRRMAQFSGSKWLGAFIADNAQNPDAIRADESLVERARQFGWQLAS
ncbi:MAG: flavodoxin family protein [Phycisphaerales bacterium]|nr:MAG: flavodoxin family protein [Phycisphaerales bacterium]